MKKIGLIFITLLLFSLTISAQEKILVEIGDKKISKNEFVKIYTKNNSSEISNNVKSVDDYLELFVNFKLKVIAAEDMGLDTASSYLSELNKYTEQLANPYFTNPELEEKLYKEAYERSKKEIRISYIYKQIPSPEDDQKIYNSINQARERIVKGEEFSVVAKEVSDSRSVKKDGGDAWYITALQSPYEIENFIYNAKIGDISEPIKVKTGYFIVQKTDEKQASGEVNASHIMVSLSKNSSEKDSLEASKKLKEIQEKLAAGEKFEDIAKQYSDDKGSGAKGGELGWFGTGKMVREFEVAAFSLNLETNNKEKKGLFSWLKRNKKKNSNISEPVRTIFGWHIIKLNDKKGIGTYEENKDKIKKKIEKDERYNLIEKSVYDNIKILAEYKEQNNLENFYNTIDSSFFNGKWDSKGLENSEKILFSITGKDYKEKDFANYLIKNQKKRRSMPAKIFADQEFEKYTKNILRKFKIKNLSETNDDFKYIVNEYHDGLLLFEITDQMVWSKAVRDTAGLQNFYNKNKNSYFEKLNLVIYSYNNEETLKKAKEIFKSKKENNLSDSAVVYKIDKTGEKFRLQNSGVFKKGDNKSADFVFDKFEKKEIENNQIYVVNTENKEIIYLNNNLKYVKGLVTADYQAKLETEWLAELKNKYKVTINQDILQEIKNEMK